MPPTLFDAGNVTRTKSGTHDTDLTHAVDISEHVASQLEWLLCHDRCLRCGESLIAGIPPMGSCVTLCRCLPICASCAEIETLIEGFDGQLELPEFWPLDPDHVEAQAQWVSITPFPA